VLALPSNPLLWRLSDHRCPLPIAMQGLVVSLPVTLVNAIDAGAALNATGRGPLSLSLSLCIHAVAVGRWCDVVCDCADMLGLAIWFVGMAMEATADNLKLASYQHDTPRCA
jgi:hypothetical protein